MINILPPFVEMAPTVKSTKTPAVAQKANPKKNSKSDINLAKDTALRGKAATNDFLVNVATASGVALGDIKKTIDGIRTVIFRQLRENGKSRVPTIMTLKFKSTPAREEGTQIIFGVEKKIKARPETKRIVMAPLKELKDGAL